jgi:hypothetical protein
MKLQTIVLGLALAVSGAAFAQEGHRDVTVVRHGDGNVTRIVRRDGRDFDRDQMRRVIVNPGHHYGWYGNHHYRRVVILHPAHHHRYVVRRTTVIRHAG